MHLDLSPAPCFLLRALVAKLIKITDLALRLVSNLDQLPNAPRRKSYKLHPRVLAIPQLLMQTLNELVVHFLLLLTNFAGLFHEFVGRGIRRLNFSVVRKSLVRKDEHILIPLHQEQSFSNKIVDFILIVPERLQL